jgi:DNA-binding CsgD family transcriptional regulator
MTDSSSVSLIGLDTVMTAAIAAGLQVLGWHTEQFDSWSGGWPQRAAVLVGDQAGNLPSYATGGTRLQPPPVVLVCCSAGIPAMAAAVREGAVAAYDADGRLPDVVSAVDATLRRDRATHPENRARLLAALRARDREAALLAALTSREREILGALMQGLVAAEIAAARHITLATVRTLIKHILAKLGLRSQLSAVAFAHRAWRGRLPRDQPGNIIDLDDDGVSWLG